MQKLKIIKFWCIAFGVIIWNTLKGNNWHMLYADFHYGDDKITGQPIRKRLIARRSMSSYDIYWQDLSVFRKQYAGNHNKRKVDEQNDK